MATQGEILKAWRKRKGYTLEQAAARVADAAEIQGVDPASKKVPRSYVALSRWEKDKVEMKELGLKLIAMAYGEDVETLRRSPPPENEQPKRKVEVSADQAAAVEAFLEALSRKAS